MRCGRSGIAGQRGARGGRGPREHLRDRVGCWIGHKNLPRCARLQRQNRKDAQTGWHGALPWQRANRSREHCGIQGQQRPQGILGIGRRKVRAGQSQKDPTVVWCHHIHFARDIIVLRDVAVVTLVESSEPQNVSAGGAGRGGAFCGPRKRSTFVAPWPDRALGDARKGLYNDLLVGQRTCKLLIRNRNRASAVVAAH